MMVRQALSEDKTINGLIPKKAAADLLNSQNIRVK